MDDRGENNDVPLAAQQDQQQELLLQLLQQQQQQQQMDNVDDGDDDDEEEEDEDDDGIDRDADGVLDGGVAGVSSSAADDSSTAAAKRRSADCDLILFIVCAENMEDIAPKHPILKEGVVVSIGLDKSTKLGSVFRRYTEFCNEHSPTCKLEDSDFEFFHCQLLSANDTAESSALMKNDRIKVRKERSAERQAQMDLKRIQRESDKEYFKQLQHLIMPNFCPISDYDVIFDCQGSVADDNGWANTTHNVLGHSAILSKRCKWIREQIKAARLELERHRGRSLPTDLPSVSEVMQGASDYVEEGAKDDLGANQIDFPAGHIVANTSSNLPEENEEGQRARGRGGMEEDDDFDDDEIGVLHFPVPQNRPQAVVSRGGAAEIEDDDNEDDENTDIDSMGVACGIPGSPVVRSLRANESSTSEHLIVTLPEHPPQAMKILMEYCYTNRVIHLGHDAFVQACRTKPVKSNGPVAPYSSARRWPNSGLPQVSFAVAIAAIRLAEEAGMRRLSLMCEVAASQLVSSANVVDALSACTLQQALTGNPLVRIREVSINTILQFGTRSVYEMPAFRQALEGRATSIIPTLLTGTAEAIASNEKNKNDKKRLSSAIAENFFAQCDRDDSYKRDRERKIRRLERDGKTPASVAGVMIKNEDEDLFIEQVHSSSWAAESARRSLKRMAHHMSMNSFNVGRAGLFTGRETQGHRGLAHPTRKRSSRRRSDRI